MPFPRKSPFVPAASSALAVAALTPHADAKIVGADLNFTLTTSDVVYLDFDNTLGHGYLHTNNEDGNEFEVGFRLGKNELPYFRSRSGTTATDASVVTFNYYYYSLDYFTPKKITGGTVIGTSSTLMGENSAAYLDTSYSQGNWAGGGSGYLGFSFLNGATDETNYGFVEINYNDDANTLELVRFAYDNTGAGILAGASLTAVPEPSTTAAVMALVAGSAALFTARRRRAAQTAAAR
jgi:hypothetical protein